MMRINLLPHREMRREKRKREFMLMRGDVCRVRRQPSCSPAAW